MNHLKQSYRSNLLRNIHTYLDFYRAQLATGETIYCPCVPSKRPSGFVWLTLGVVSVIWVWVLGAAVYQNVPAVANTFESPLLYGFVCFLLWLVLLFAVSQNIKSQNPAARLSLSSGQLTVYLEDGALIHCALPQAKLRFWRSKGGNSSLRESKFRLRLEYDSGKRCVFVDAEEEEQFFSFVVCMSVACGFRTWDVFNDDTLYELYHSSYYRDLLKKSA